MEPLLSPLQVMLKPPATVGLVIVEVNVAGCVMVTLVFLVQPLLSVTVTLKVAAASPVAVAVVCPFDHRYV